MDVALELRRASGVRAITHGFTLGAMRRRAADWAELRHDEFTLFTGSSLTDDLDHLRDYIARALNDYGVADADVLAADLVFIVEGSPAHDYTANIDRLEYGQRSQCTG